MLVNYYKYVPFIMNDRCNVREKCNEDHEIRIGVIASAKYASVRTTHVALTPRT
jgi:hypothetical protein